VRALVLALFLELPRSGGNDAGTGIAGGPYHHLPLGAVLCPRAGETLQAAPQAPNDSWRVDETSIKIKGTWTYLYRAVDSEGNTLEFLLSPTRDAEAAKRFFVKALHSTARSAPQVCPAEEPVTEPTATADPDTIRSAPRVINVDKNAAYPKAMAELKAAGILPEQVELRQVKYLNNMVEQDHRFIKRRVKPGLGFFSFETAWNTGHRYEVMHMVRKGQRRGVEKGDILGQIAFIARLFGVAA